MYSIATPAGVKQVNALPDGTAEMRCVEDDS